MTLLFVLLVALVAITIAGGVLAHRRRLSVAGGPTAWGVAMSERLGPVGGAAAIWIAGWLVVLVVGLALGFLAKHTESAIDQPIFRWVYPRVHDGRFTHANNTLTLMGNTPIIELVCMVAMIVLACVYRSRWWIPVVAIAVSFFAERYLQKGLATIVDRGHPPTTRGTYPSGGVGRLLAIYAAVLILVLLVLPAASRAWQAGIWTGLVTAGVVEAFTRVYLSKHWFTDALFALPFGVLLVLTNIAAISALAHRRTTPDRRDTAPEATRENLTFTESTPG